MNNLIKISELFDLKYGNSLELINLEQCKSTDFNSIPFVSRTEKNNGISTYVYEFLDIEPNSAHTLTVALGGSVLSTFYQPIPYYTGFHVLVLSPKNEMSEIEMLFYAKCISSNKYKYNYGRQANKTLKDILIPPKIDSDFSNYLKGFKYNLIQKLSDSSILNQELNLNIENWKFFKINDLFEVKYGINLELNKMEVSTSGIPFISRTSNNNGVSAYVEVELEIEPNPENTISVSGGGSVLECFLQIRAYYSGRDLYYLLPKFEATKYILLFIITIIKLEKYRYNYGRQANKTLPNLNILLPSKKNSEPDFEFMENYIKTVKYSKAL